jgi:hypothetical protein
MPALWIATAQNLTLTAAGRTARKARACGTLAPLIGEQAAEGQTARLSGEPAPGGDAERLLALGLKRSQTVEEIGSSRRPKKCSRMCYRE